MTHKKRGGLLSLDIIAWIALALILFGIGTYVGADLVHAYRADLLRQQASSIDQALLLYSRSHQTTGSVVVKKGDGTKSVQAETLPTYPAEITSLGVIKEVKDYPGQDTGYFSRMAHFINTKTSSGTTEATKGYFRYKPIRQNSKDAPAEYYDVTSDAIIAYDLEVTLPNGQNYFSPNSRHGTGGLARENAQK